MTEDIVSDNSDFDFANAKNVKETGTKEKPKEDETPENIIAKLSGKLGGKAKEIKKLKNQIATSGSLTPKIIKEARELAESKKGLDIESFMRKHKLISVDVEQLLNAPLKKDGSFA